MANEPFVRLSGFTKERRIARRETPQFAFGWKDSVGRKVDLTGSTLTFMLKDNINDDDADAVLTKALTILGSATNGQALLSLTTAETDRTGSFWAEIEGYWPDTESRVKLSQFVLRIGAAVKTT